MSWLFVVRGGAVWAYIEREEGNILIAVVDIVYDGDGRLPRSAEPLVFRLWWCGGLIVRGAFLAVDQVGDLEV